MPNETILERRATPRQARARERVESILVAARDIIEHEGVEPLSTQRIAKVAGSRSYALKGRLALLEMAIIRYSLDKLLAKNFELISVPAMAREFAFTGSGHFPTGREQVYHLPEDDIFLAGTAEVPVNALHAGEMLDEKQLPILYGGVSACFRREAGSYGKDVRGLNRLHQFDKVEIVQIAHPEKSYQILEEMRAHVAGLLRELELPFRILKLCGGDMSFASALTYDFEVYSAAQQKWLEVSSVSNFESFQANRLKLRFKDEKGKPQLAHTLNGSSLALPRIVASLLENNQTATGIKLPAVLHPYFGASSI